MHLRNGVAAMAVAATVVAFPQKSMADATVADFLTWERSAQDGFMQISIGMIGTIATQIRPDMATCIDNWYFGRPDAIEAEHDAILDIMAGYGEYDPTAFMLAYAENKCGKLR